MKKSTKKSTKKVDPIVARVKRAFSLGKVKARYEAIGHKPTTGTYGSIEHNEIIGGPQPVSCLLGSFEHMLAIEAGRIRKGGLTYGANATTIGEKVRVPAGAIEALEAGFENWDAGREESAKSIRAEYDINKTQFKAIYAHGRMLAEKLL
jgi:hypothetical protein